MISVVSKPRSDKFENFWTSSFGSRISVNLLISIQAMQCIFNVRSTSTISRMAALIGRDRATQKVDSIFSTKSLTQLLERTKVHSGHRAKMSSSPDSSSTPLTLQITRLDRKPDDPKVFFFCLSDCNSLLSVSRQKWNQGAANFRAETIWLPLPRQRCIIWPKSEKGIIG